MNNFFFNVKQSQDTVVYLHTSSIDHDMVTSHWRTRSQPIAYLLGPDLKENANIHAIGSVRTLQCPSLFGSVDSKCSEEMQYRREVCFLYTSKRIILAQI